jgi:hypothetical protein
MTHLRRSLLWTGLAGLLANASAAAVAAWLVTSGRLKPPLPNPAIVLLIVAVFGVFSLAEIPVMVVALRRLAVERAGNRGVVLGLNALYVFFAAVYGLPVLLLTGSLGGGFTLCGLGVVRLASSLWFVRGPAP